MYYFIQRLSVRLARSEKKVSYSRSRAITAYNQAALCLGTAGKDGSHTPVRMVFNIDELTIVLCMQSVSTVHLTQADK